MLGRGPSPQAGFLRTKSCTERAGSQTPTQFICLILASYMQTKRNSFDIKWSYRVNPHSSLPMGWDQNVAVLQGDAPNSHSTAIMGARCKPKVSLAVSAGNGGAEGGVKRSNAGMKRKNRGQEATTLSNETLFSRRKAAFFAQVKPYNRRMGGGHACRSAWKCIY